MVNGLMISLGLLCTGTMICFRVGRKNAHHKFHLALSILKSYPFDKSAEANDNIAYSRGKSLLGKIEAN